MDEWMGENVCIWTISRQQETPVEAFAPRVLCTEHLADRLCNEWRDDRSNASPLQIWLFAQTNDQ